ncbi:MAG: hypothetical protein MI743_10585 [Sneathiellales bacterium]|nr:hypothetical protein [Sneathiellales bacterium]
MIEESLNAVHADGTRMTITIKIASPTPCENPKGDWVTDVSLSPFFVSPPKIYGISALQSLSLSLSLVRKTLDGFQKMGGKIMTEEGEVLGPVADWLESR